MKRQTKRTAHEWQKIFPTPIILDPDGWRLDDGVTMNTPITESEYVLRRSSSTVMAKRQDKQPELFQDDAAENRARLIRGTAQPRARARRADPETSHEAAKSVVELRKRQQAVLEVLKDGPATDEELVGNYPAFGWEEADYPKQSPSGLRTRRSELVALGLVRHSGQFKLTKSGRRTRVWEVV